MVTIHFSNSLPDIIVIAECKSYPLFDSFVSRSFLSWNIYIYISLEISIPKLPLCSFQRLNTIPDEQEKICRMFITLFLCIYSFPVFRKRFSKDS